MVWYLEEATDSRGHLRDEGRVFKEVIDNLTETFELRGIILWETGRTMP